MSFSWLIPAAVSQDVREPSCEDEYACTTDGPDGYLDLTLKFDTEAVVAALGEVDDGDIFCLTLTGELFDDTPISGSDVIRIIKKGRNSGD